MLDYLTKEDLPELLRDFVDVIGMDSMKELIRLARGSSLYIHSENSVTKPVKNKIIKEAFNGNYKQLSRKFGISEVHFRNTVNFKSY
jgi:Mor family transcriptional regulator